MNGDLDLTQVSGAFAFVQNGLTLNGTARLGNAVGTTYGELYFTNTETLSGTGTVLFGKSGNNFLQTQNTGTILTLAPTITAARECRHAGPHSGSDTIINQGTISADDSGGQSVVSSTTRTSPAAAPRPRRPRSTPAGSPIRRRRWFIRASGHGNFTYTLPGLTAGNHYTLRLHFAELDYRRRPGSGSSTSVSTAPRCSPTSTSSPRPAG